MTLTNPTTAISTLSTMVKATPTWATMSASDTWYPDLNIRGATLPAAVLSPISRVRTPYAAGASGIPSGSARITLFANTDAGTLEGWAESMLDDLVLAGQNSGLPIRGGSTGNCSDPTPGQRAAAQEVAAPTVQYRTIDIEIEYGLHT